MCCENCQRALQHPQLGLVKLYKRCILLETIDQDLSLILCGCPLVEKTESDGQKRALFPMSPTDQHRPSCSLFTLREWVIKAKAAGLLARHRRGEKVNGPILKKLKEFIPLPLQSTSIRKNEYSEGSNSSKSSGNKHGTSSLKKNGIRISTSEIDAGHEKIVLKRDSDVPALFRPVTDRMRFGNVHMTLQFGPLVIENGVPGLVIEPFCISSSFSIHDYLMRLADLHF